MMSVEQVMDAIQNDRKVIADQPTTVAAYDHLWRTAADERDQACELLAIVEGWARGYEHAIPGFQRKVFARTEAVLEEWRARNSGL